MHALMVHKGRLMAEAIRGPLLHVEFVLFSYTKSSYQGIYKQRIINISLNLQEITSLHWAVSG